MDAVRQIEPCWKKMHYSEDILKVGSRVLGILLASSESDMYADVLDLILDTFESEFGFFGYINEAGDLVCPSMTRNIWETCQVPEKRIVFPRKAWGGLWGQILIEKKSHYKNAIHKTPPGHIPLHRSLGSPILFHGRLLGSLHVANRKVDYTDEDLAMMDNIAGIIAPVLSARLERDRQDEARRQAEATRDRHARELADANASLQRLNDELKSQVEEHQKSMQVIQTQAQQLQSLLREISTPVIQVWEGVLVTPLIGTFDTLRMQEFMTSLLELISSTGSAIALIDITGLPTVDTNTAQHLFKTTAAVRLLGAQVVLTGVRPAIAQAMIHLGLDLSGIITRSSLAAGLKYAFDVLNLRVTSIPKS